MKNTQKRLELHRACKDAINTLDGSLLGNEFANVSGFLLRRLTDQLEGWTDEQVDNLYKAFLEKPEEEKTTPSKAAKKGEKK